MCTSGHAFILYVHKYPSVSLSWVQVPKCFFIMGTSTQVFLYYGHKYPCISLLWAQVPKCFFIMGTSAQMLGKTFSPPFLHMNDHTYINKHNTM